MVLQAKTKITADVFYGLPEYGEHEFIELIDGEVVIGVGARTKHQSVVVKMILLFGRMLPQQGGQIFTAPTEVYLDHANLFEPDVFYLAASTKCVVEEKRVIGAPEMVVEVLSPSAAKVDRVQKFRAYEAYGVLEYWIADPFNDTLEVWVLRDGALSLMGIFDPEDTFESTVLTGLTVKVAELFAS